MIVEVGNLKRLRMGIDQLPLPGRDKTNPYHLRSHLRNPLATRMASLVGRDLSIAAGLD